MCSTFKPEIAHERVLSLLRETFDGTVHDLVPLHGGQIARSFRFRFGGQLYVVRFAKEDSLGGFAKEAFVAQRLAPRVPIATLVRIGHVQELDYAISAFVAGRTLDKVDAAESAVVTPALITALDAIHDTDLGGWLGAGVFDANGAGRAPSWHAHLAAIREEEGPSNFHGRWHTLFAESYLERDLFDAVYAEMIELLPFCPEERFLVHGDYGFDNVLAEGGTITAVLDWTNAMFGDFLYDVAYLRFFPSHEDFAARFRAHYAATRRDVPNFEARMRCYTCYIGLDSLRFFAMADQRGNYDWARHRLRELLSTPSR